MTLEVLLHKEIDSIIDEAKASGLYRIDKINTNIQKNANLFNDNDWSDSNESLCNEHKNKNLINCESIPKLQQCVSQIESNFLPRSDSDVTIIRIKKQRTKLKTQTNNKWEGIHDKAVPGDGTHLADSPSLVNLVTFVNSDTSIKKEAGEYLVPLSSWDPIHTKAKHSSIVTIDSSEIHFEKTPGSSHKSEIFNSRLNISYMKQQKLLPRPGALFSQNSTIVNLESENDLQFDNNNNKVQTMQAPSCENDQHHTIKNRLHKFICKVLCACCVFEPVNRKTRDTFEIGVQTVNNDLEQ